MNYTVVQAAISGRFERSVTGGQHFHVSTTPSFLIGETRFQTANVLNPSPKMHNDCSERPLHQYLLGASLPAPKIWIKGTPAAQWTHMVLRALPGRPIGDW